MNDDLWEHLENFPGKTNGELKIERLIEEARQRYYDEHGRWPEEDGLIISVNL